MLDAQRYRGNSYRTEVYLTRWVAWTHVGLSLLVIVLLLLHELFIQAAVGFGWFLATMLLIAGMCQARDFCRILLGLAFLGFTVGGIYFLGQVLPKLPLESPPLLPRSTVPFWLGLINLIYAGAGLGMFLHPAFRKACSIGFKPW
jgi:hypothetical protein